MSWLRLIGLTCSSTQEAEDEISIQCTWDWGPGGRVTANILHAHTMDVGDSVTLDYVQDFEHAAMVTLLEDDSTGPDEILGSVLITPLYEGTGEHTITIDSPGRGSYYLTFEVTRYRREEGMVILRLLSLTCVDAKEWPEDEAVLKVNDCEIWSDEMRTGDSRTLDLITEFRTEAEIALWERDPARSEEIDSHTASRIEIGRGPQRVTLSRDEGIFGDATYRLLYQVE